MDEDMLALVFRDVAQQIREMHYYPQTHEVLTMLADGIEQQGISRRQAEHMDSGR